MADPVLSSIPMYLIQILLPLADNAGQPFPNQEYARVRAELTEHFGGLTAYSRAPAEGLWKEGPARASHDDIVVFEVMSSKLDRNWWSRYRATLEERFRQDVIVIRAQSVELL